MTRHETSREPISVELTGARFSFADANIGRSDEYRYDGPRGSRVIEYRAKPGADQIVEALVKEGLVVGREIEPATAGDKAFVVPRTLRPVHHDAATISSSPYAYDDRALFRDMGLLLREVSEIAPGTELLIDDVVNNVSVIKFTGIEDRRLFLVPGFEHGLREVGGIDEIRAAYFENLSRDLGTRFERVAPDFLEGFQKE